MKTKTTSVNKRQAIIVKDLKTKQDPKGGLKYIFKDVIISSVRKP